MYPYHIRISGNLKETYILVVIICGIICSCTDCANYSTTLDFDLGPSSITNDV